MTHCSFHIMVQNVIYLLLQTCIISCFPIEVAHVLNVHMNVYNVSPVLLDCNILLLVGE